MHFFRRIILELEKRQIKYLVIGGLAVNLYGYSRVTRDLDIMLSFDEENVQKFIVMIKEVGFIPRVPVDIIELADPAKRLFWRESKNMKVFTVLNPDNDFEYIDIMIMDYLNFDEAYKQREILSDGDLTVSTISFDDLIKLKEISGRDRDLYDIKILKQIMEKEIGK